MELSYAIGGRLNQCNKSMYVGSNSEIRRFLIKNIPDWKHMYVGNDKFLPHSRAWTMEGMQWDRQHVIYNQLQATIHSGIFHFLNHKHSDEVAICMYVLWRGLSSTLIRPQ